MSIYKVEKCYSCKDHKHNVGHPPLPGNRAPAIPNKPCPKCREMMRYVQKEKKDVYYICLQVNGHKYPKAVGPRYDDAIAALGKQKSLVREDKFFDMKQTTPWQTAAEALKKTYSDLDLDTQKMYDLCLTKLAPYFGRMALEDITITDLNNYKEKRLTEGVGAASFNRERSTIKRMFSLTGIPWNFPKTIFKRMEEKKRELDLEPEEIAAIEACLKLPHLALAYLITTDTGMRRTEVLSLDITKDINLKDRSIKKIGKGKKETWRPMTSRIYEALTAYIQSNKITRLLFPSPRDPEKPMQDLKKSWKTAQRNAGIKKPIPWHMTRHLFSRDFSENVSYDPKAKQDLMGHSDINLTMGTYTKTRREHLRKRMEEFEQNTQRNIGQPVKKETTPAPEWIEEMPEVPELIKEQLIKAGWTPPTEQNRTVH